MGYASDLNFYFSNKHNFFGDVISFSLLFERKYENYVIFINNKATPGGRWV